MPYEQKSEDDESNSDENVLNSSTDTIIFFQTKIKNEVNDDDDDVEVIEIPSEIPATSFQLQISEVVSLASTDTQELEQQWNDDTTSNGKFFLKIILKIKLKINL